MAWTERILIGFELSDPRVDNLTRLSFIRDCCVPRSGTEGLRGISRINKDVILYQLIWVWDCHDQFDISEVDWVAHDIRDIHQNIQQAYGRDVLTITISPMPKYQ